MPGSAGLSSKFLAQKEITAGFACLAADDSQQ